MLGGFPVYQKAPKLYVECFMMDLGKARAKLVAVIDLELPAECWDNI